MHIVSIYCSWCMYCILLPVSPPDSLCDPSQFAVHYDVFSGCQLQSTQLRHEHNVTACLREACHRRSNTVNYRNETCYFRACEGNDTRLGTFWPVHPATYIYQGNVKHEQTVTMVTPSASAIEHCTQL